jgi:hypothetical protein
MDKLNFLLTQKERLENLKNNLLPSQMSDFSDKTKKLSNLINILENDKNISKSRLKEEEMDIKKEIDKLKDEDREDKSSFLNAIGISPDITPTDETIPYDVQQKAKMIEASKVFHNSGGDLNKAQQILDQFNIPYQIDSELSNKNGLIIHNAETGDTKAVFRGTRISNLDDLYTDGLIIAGQETADTPQFKEAENMVTQAQEKYGIVNEGLGYSKGSALNIQTAERTGIPRTTNFNPLIGYSMTNPKTQNSQHQMWRTTEDIPSLGMSFLADKGNVEARVVRPKAGSITPKAAHDLNQFYGDEIRVTESELQKSMEKIGTTSGRHGEADMLSKMLSDTEGSKYTNISSDLYNVNAKIKASGNHPFVGHDLTDPLLNSRNPNNVIDRNQVVTTRDDDGFEEYNPDEFEEELRTEDDILQGLQDSDDNIPRRPPPRDVPQQLDIDEPDTLTDIRQQPKPKTLTRGIQRKLPNLNQGQKKLFKRIIDRQLNSGDIEQDQYDFEKSHYIDGENSSHPKMFEWASERQIKSFTNTKNINKRLLDRGKITQETFTKRINTLDSQIINEKLNGVRNRINQNHIADVPPSVVEETGGVSTNNGLTYSEWVAGYNGRAGKFGGSDTFKNPETGEINITGGRMSENSLQKKLWGKITGDDFTEQEKTHFDTIKTDTKTSRGQLLTDAEHQELINASPEERQTIVDRYYDEALDAINQQEINASFPTENENVPRATKSQLAGQLNPLSLGVGLWAGKKAQAIADTIDPNGQYLGKQGSTTRTGFIGAGTGFLSESILAPLSGSAPAFIPAIIAGAGGAIAGQQTYNLIKGMGGNELQAQIGSGSIGGLGATGSLLLADTALGTEYGSALGPEGMLIGAGIGGLIGVASYFGHQMDLF